MFRRVAFGGALVEQPNLVGGGSDRRGRRTFIEHLHEYLLDNGGNVRRGAGGGKLRQNSFNLYVVLAVGTVRARSGPRGRGGWAHPHTPKQLAILNAHAAENSCALKTPLAWPSVWT